MKMQEEFKNEYDEVAMNDKDKESFKQLIKQARERFAAGIESMAKGKYEKDSPAFNSWSDFAKKIKSGEPVKLTGPIENDFLDAALHSIGIWPTHRKEDVERYRAVWEAIEKGSD